jgi:hypothetical protein
MKSFRKLVAKLTEFEIDKLNIDASFKTVQKIYFEMFRYHLSQIKRCELKPNTSLFRVRKNISDKLFKEAKDLSYPPANMTPFGRVNLIGNPVYYCSDNSTTAILESKPEVGDFITLTESTLLKSIIVAVIGDNSRYDSLSTVGENLKLFYEMTARFTDSNVSDETEYLFSATLANVILSDKIYSGLLYPSIYSRSQADNIALSIDNLENILLFKKATQFEIIKKINDNHLVLKCKATTCKNSMIKTLLWSSVSNCNTHEIEFDKILLVTEN